MFSTFQADVPQIWVDIDREKAKKQGVPLDEIFATLQTQLGSYYVNDFNKFGRVYRVILQAERAYRQEPEDILRLYVRNQRDEMVPLRTLVSLSSTLGPETIRRYNLYRAAQSTARPRPATAPATRSPPCSAWRRRCYLRDDLRVVGRHASGTQGRTDRPDPVRARHRLRLPFLVAQYESWSIPLAVMLSVPLAALGAVAGLLLVGLNNDIYAQIGMVLLIGLAAKNAILIVEFAQVKHEQGMDAREAAVTAGNLRFRAIMMTAFSFILGVVPLLIASGAGAAARQSLGTTVFSGMLAAIVGTLLVPTFYVGIQDLVERLPGRRRRVAPAPGGSNKRKAARRAALLLQMRENQAACRLTAFGPRGSRWTSKRTRCPSDR